MFNQFKGLQFVNSKNFKDKKLPQNKFYRFPNFTQLPYFEPEILIKYINETLSGIEGIRGKYCEDRFLWQLEWGTRPIEYTIDNDDYKLFQIIKHKKYAATMAAVEANKRYLNNIIYYDDDDDDEFYLAPIRISDNKWFKFTIMLSYEEDKDCIIIEYNRLTGDAISYYDIIDTIKKNLLDIKNLNWFKRLGYVLLIDGIDEKYISGHIMKYICNDVIMREICSF